MAARIHVPQGLIAGQELALPDAAARHVQVLRLQPGAGLILFDGAGGEWAAELLSMGRKSVHARVISHRPVERELARRVTLAVGMPANERMDSLVEKATELGVARIVPLVCTRSVLRVAGARADRKAAHWRAIAVAACEQSGRNRVPEVAAPLALKDWLAQDAAQAAPGCRAVLSFAATARPLRALLDAAGVHSLPVTLLSGPEGGLSGEETAMAERQGFQPITLGARILRADTAPLAALAGLCALDQA